jgi:hypothetical protein
MGTHRIKLFDIELKAFFEKKRMTKTSQKVIFL